MTKRIEKPFLVVVMIVSMIAAGLHFIRLSLGWDFIIHDWDVPTLVSSFIIVITIFITYWAWIILTYEESEKSDKKKSEKEEFPEEGGENFDG